MTTQTQTDSNMNNTNYLGSTMLILGGVVVFFLLVLGSLTDNRFGTHMVLNSDLSSGPAWYLILISLISMAVVAAGVTLIILDKVNVFKINDSRDRALTTGSLFLMGSAAFVLALSSISFAAFNWQFFESQIQNGTADAAIAMMSLSIIGIVASLGYIVFGLIVPVNQNEKLYLTLRNTSVAFVALGWFVFNVCINSFGSMGGDAAVLVDGLLGKDDVLANIGSILQNNEISGLDIYHFVTGEEGEPDKGNLVWNNIIAAWDGKTPSPVWGALNLIHEGLGDFIKDEGGIGAILSNSQLTTDLVELGSGKEGPIMGVNNSMNSMMIFSLLITATFIGLPVYAGLTYSGTSKDKPSIMYISSIIIIIAMSVIYLFLLLTPYMVSYDPATQHVGILGLLFTGNYDPSIAPGLIALPGEPGGIHSAIVYFSDEYNGTIVWWIAETLTFIAPVAAFVSTTLFIKLKK